MVPRPPHSCIPSNTGAGSWMGQIHFGYCIGVGGDASGHFVLTQPVVTFEQKERLDEYKNCIRGDSGRLPTAGGRRRTSSSGLAAAGPLRQWAWPAMPKIAAVPFGAGFRSVRRWRSNGGTADRWRRSRGLRNGIIRHYWPGGCGGMAWERRRSWLRSLFCRPCVRALSRTNSSLFFGSHLVKTPNYFITFGRRRPDFTSPRHIHQITSHCDHTITNHFWRKGNETDFDSSCEHPLVTPLNTTKQTCHPDGI